MRTTPIAIAFLTLLFVVVGSAGAPGQTYLFDRTVGGPGEDAGNAIALDDEGNVYMAGSFNGTVNFGGGDRISAGGEDIYIVKFDREGNYLWDYTRGDASDDDVAYSMKVDSEGNLLVSGSFVGSIDFGGGLRRAAGGIDIFILKLDPDGNWIWDHTYGNRNNQAGVALAVDHDDNVIVTGRYRNPINFGGGPRPPAGMRDMFVVKLDTGGAYLWDRTFGGEGRDSGRRVAVDADDNIYIVGNFEYTVDFGGGERTEGNTSFYDGYLLKLDPSGNYLADDTWGGAAEDAIWGVAVSSGGDVCVTGYFGDVVNFGGGNRYAVGSWDICVVKYDGDCNYLWDVTCGGAGEDFGFDISLLGDDQIFVSGVFENSIDFGGGARSSAGDKDIFILKFDSDGGYLWDETLGGNGRDRVDGIIVDLFEGMYLTGSFGDMVDFGGGDRKSNGGTDAFLVKYMVPVPATVDIKPDNLNLRSHGRWVTCYIEVLEGFDVYDIDISTIRVNDIVPAEAHPSSIGDRDEDGLPDLMVKFGRQDVIALLHPGENVCLNVSGEVGDHRFSGSDCVRTMGPGRCRLDDEDITPPTGTLMMKAHPNPFNPTVRIAYNVPKPGRVLIQIWDIAGRLVRTLEDADKAEGTYSTEWNGMNGSGVTVASGMYLCRLSVGGEAVTKKLMLLR